MGGFINSQADNEICEVLNKRFSDDVIPGRGQTYLDALRDHFQHKENFFDGNHHLNRVFHRLAISVTGGQRVPKHDKSRFRWLFLLRKNLPTAVTDAIKGQLSAILGPPGVQPAGAIDYVTFLTRHVTTATRTFELWPQNSTVPVICNDANGKSYCTIVLECHTDAPLPDNPNEPDPPGPDGGETNISARTKGAPKKSRTRNSAVKKRGAKKKKAVVKKSAAKKAKKGKPRG